MEFRQQGCLFEPWQMNEEKEKRKILINNLHAGLFGDIRNLMWRISSSGALKCVYKCGVVCNVGVIKLRYMTMPCVFKEINLKS